MNAAADRDAAAGGMGGALNALREATIFDLFFLFHTASRSPENLFRPHWHGLYRLCINMIHIRRRYSPSLSMSACRVRSTMINEPPHYSRHSFHINASPFSQVLIVFCFKKENNVLSFLDTSMVMVERYQAMTPRKNLRRHLTWLK